VLAFLIIAILAAPLYIDPVRVVEQNIMNRFQPPGRDHLFGTDQFGRDLFARIIYGGRISLFAGFVTIGITFFFGILLGVTSGYFAGKVDGVIMRFCDVLMAVPSLLLSMAIVTALGMGLFNMLIALSVSAIPELARTVRAAVISLRGQEYVEAAKTYGSSNALILIKQIIPNIVGPLIISITMSLGGTILRIANLGFLGIGVASPTPEWGTIISENQTHIRFYPYLGTVPGLFIMVTVLSLNFIGDGLRDALDPKMKN
jgi:peptide/nickel transport system permease protein